MRFFSKLFYTQRSCTTRPQALNAVGTTRNVVALHVRRTLNAKHTRRRLYTALAHYAYNKVRTREEIVA